MKKAFNKGFTLIELLVVIAIIGILAGIVLASLGSARTGAQDAKVQETLSSLRTAAEVYYGSTGGYSDGTAAIGSGTDCVTSVTSNVFGNTNVAAQLASLTTTKYCTHDGTSSAKAAKWAVAVVLPSANTSAWCVDSTGASKKETIVAATGPSDAIAATACK
ncbi:MAG TPA: prepilin-type N-terminal cleavage/methylation domain-containing protein [Candidatus Paceibacterota bacterium]|nr:prepilin-type N-terminal cleavage/methylation domain-containing protein [Candidatus Paceibacterota bacterium]